MYGTPLSGYSASTTSSGSSYGYSNQSPQQSTNQVPTMDFFIQDVNFSLHTKASADCEIQLYRLTNPMDAQISIFNTLPQHQPPPYLASTVYALQIHLEKFLSQNSQWVQCTNDSATSPLFKDYDAFVVFNQTNQQSITNLIQTDGKSLYIQVPLQLGFFCNQSTCMTFRSKLNTSKEKQGYKRGESAIFRVVFSLLRQQQGLHTYLQNKYESIPFGIINHGKNSTAVGMYKNIKLSSIPGTVEYTKSHATPQFVTPQPFINQTSPSSYTTASTPSPNPQTMTHLLSSGTNYSQHVPTIEELEYRQIQEMLDILNQEEQALAKQSSSSNYSSGDSMYMSDDEDFFREIVAMENYFTSSGGEESTQGSVGFPVSPNTMFAAENGTNHIDEFCLEDDEEEADFDFESDIIEGSSSTFAQKESTSMAFDDVGGVTNDSKAGFWDSLSQTTAPPQVQNQMFFSTLGKPKSDGGLLRSSGVPPTAPSVKKQSVRSSELFGSPPPPPQSYSSNNTAVPPSSNSVHSSLSTPTSSAESDTWSSPIESSPSSSYQSSQIQKETAYRSRSVLSSVTNSSLSSVNSQPKPVMLMSQSSQPPPQARRMTFGVDYIKNEEMEEAKEEKAEKKKKSKLSIGKLFRKHKKSDQESEKVEDKTNPLEKQNNATFFNNFKPNTMVQLRTDQIVDNRQAVGVTKRQQSGGASTEEDLIASMTSLTLAPSDKNGTTTNTPSKATFDPKKITFNVGKQGDSSLGQEKKVLNNNIGKGKKPIPTFKSGDIIQFAVINKNDRDLLEKTSLIVGTTIPNKSVVRFSSESVSTSANTTTDKKTSNGFTVMKDSTVMSQSVQLPVVTKDPKVVVLVLFMKVLSDGKERLFTNKRKILVTQK